MHYIVVEKLEFLGRLWHRGVRHRQAKVTQLVGAGGVNENVFDLDIPV